MRAHSVGWGAGVRFRSGYIEDVLLGYRHKVDVRMYALCLGLNKQATLPVGTLPDFAKQHNIEVSDLHATLRGLARRGLIRCYAYRLTPRQAVYYLWTAIFAYHVTRQREAATLLVRSYAVRYDIRQLGLFEAWRALAFNVLLHQGPLLFILGMLLALLAMIYAHVSMWIAMPAGVLIAPAVTVLHEWVHLALVRRYKLSGVLIVAPHKLSVVYRKATASQQVAISAAGPAAPGMAWLAFGAPVLLFGGPVPQGISAVWLLASIVQAISFLPFMKDGRAILQAIKIVMNRGKYATQPTIVQK